MLTNLQGNVQHLEGRINNQILGVERLKGILQNTKIGSDHSELTP